MKVLVANNYYYLRGGAERVMFNDIQALTGAGVQVIPFSASDPKNVPGAHNADFARGADIHATNPFVRLQAAREAIHCDRTAQAFEALLEKTRPDVIHYHNIYGRLTTSILPVARKLGIPAVLTTHDYKVVCPSYLMLRDGKPCSSCVDGNYYRCATNRCHKQNLAASIVYSAEAYHAQRNDSYGAVSEFLCPSRFIADLIVKSGVAQSRVVYHPNCIDTAAFAPQYSGEYVLYAGRLSHEKGIQTLVNAMVGTGIPLRIAGGGPLEAELRAQAAAAGSAITFEGHCDGEKLRSLYRNAAFVVVPSEWYENAPMSILESFAYGKPVIGARIGGIPELISHGENGKLFAWGNRVELQQAVQGLWADADARQQMGLNARRLIETTFSQERRSASLLSIYERLRNGHAMQRAA